MKSFLSIIGLVLLIIINTFPAACNADMYKCIDENGNVMFTNTSCPRGYQIEKSIQEDHSSTQPKSKISRYGGAFEFDGFIWRIIRTHRLDVIGRQSNIQRPKNDYFYVVEAELKNISSEPRYYGDFILMDGENQYQDSSKVDTYTKYQLGYSSEDSTKFEPQARLKTYFGFDVKASHNFTLIIKGWGGSDERFKVTLY